MFLLLSYAERRRRKQKAYPEDMRISQRVYLRGRCCISEGANAGCQEHDTNECPGLVRPECVKYTATGEQQSSAGRRG
jgi:hypothetical protein